MSRNMNNFTPLPGHSWQRGFGSFDESNEVPVFYRSHSTRATDDRNSGVLARQWFWDFRNPLGFHSIPNFPAPPPRRQHIHVHNADMGRLREIFFQPPQRSTFQTSTQVPPPVVEISKTTALSKLKKVVHDPPPKRYARRVSLYYRNNVATSSKEKEREKDEDGKGCAICLEDFEPSEEVMLTPCNHMFHEDCIVPWLTSKGQCPVCRFVICEIGRGNDQNPNSSFNNNNGIANLEHGNLVNGEVLSILRAMEEAFQLGSVTY